jgi:dihydroorotase-like cyclic amidohydrolase
MANLTLVNLGQAWKGESQTYSKSSNSPYTGLDFKGKVVHTIYDGEFTLRNQKLRENKGDV